MKLCSDSFTSMIVSFCVNLARRYDALFSTVVLVFEYQVVFEISCRFICRPSLSSIFFLSNNALSVSLD